MRILIFSIVLAGCTTPFSGDYPTGAIRELWSHCVRGIGNSGRMVSPGLAVLWCDCLTDRTREEFPWEDVVKNPNDRERKRRIEQLAIECVNGKSPAPANS